MNIENPVITDYAKPAHWLSLHAHPSKPVDVFYIYPTVWAKVDPAEPDYCPIDHPGMLRGAASAFSHQATAFETAGNVYAPFYRQADGACTLPLTEDQRWEVLRKVPAADVTAAFDYYLRHYNNGRPYIIAGHSQGSSVMMFLLSEYMTSHPDVYARMIAAYVIGYPVTADFMAANKHLKFAEGPDDTGVIISYNTQSPEVVPGTNIVVANNVGLVINPVNWKRDATPAPASENLGSYMPDSTITHYDKKLNFADARIDPAQGVIICSSVNDSDIYAISNGLDLGIYHIYDINFYYYNLRDNAERRAGKFHGN
ncbi:MAG: DUF3089 domain-containing protein [Bacteroidetes bacterium]|nr:DUF3089 domain-containing protein [Bacteroidota bacterium]